ncbi:armadillo-type protein [Pisolithus microcarpus]|nr:armadillo-type protein [Pisolithus microcarpus]
MNASELLADLCLPDASTRQRATEQLENASRENYPAYMLMLSSELANESSQIHIRNAAALALKNSLSARAKIKQEVLVTLASPLSRAGGFSAQVVAAIASVELPHDQWPDLIELLLGSRTLQTIGYICESIKPEILSLRSNEILTAVIHDVQLAAVHALYNSLEFVRENFEREGERNYIMQVVCEATQNPSVSVQVGAFECLVKIMALYYDKMAFYMEQALFGLTVMGMKHSDERVALQAVEFWTTVCEEEIELAHEAREAADYGEPPEVESKFFAKIALPEVIPVLLSLLTRQEEDADEDEWNISMSAGTCLNFMAQAVTDPIVDAVIPFIEAHINGKQAVMAFGSILDGPDPSVLTRLVNQALPLLIGMMSDSNIHVKDTVAWTLGRICDLLVVTIKPDVHLHPLVSALVTGLQDNPRIVTNCCWALMNLADQLEFLEEEGVVNALLRVTDTTSNEANFRTSAYEAITSYVTHATNDNTLITILMRMQQLLGMQNQIVGIDDRNNWNELQSNLCSVVISVTRRLGEGIQPMADRIMTLVLQLIQAAGKTSTVLEDAFLAVGSLASGALINSFATALESNFAPYIQAFLQFLFPALKAHEDTQLCMVAYANAFMSALLENLQSDVLNRNVKISILSCFGDIALAIGCCTTMGVLQQAGGVQPNPLDFDLVDYGILEAYTGIVTGFKNTEKVGLLLPHSATILELTQRCLADEERTESTLKLCFGLIGDLADCFPDETKKTMRWAREMIKRATT